MGSGLPGNVAGAQTTKSTHIEQCWLEEDIGESGLAAQMKLAVNLLRMVEVIAFCEGVAVHVPSGSRSGGIAGSSLSRREAYHHAKAEMPASNMMMLTPVHTTASPVGRFPTSGSWGQLLV